MTLEEKTEQFVRLMLQAGDQQYLKEKLTEEFRDSLTDEERKEIVEILKGMNLQSN